MRELLERRFGRFVSFTGESPGPWPPRAVRAPLLAQPHVVDVHDLHASQIPTGLPVLTAHVVVDDSCFFDGHAPRVLDQLQDCLAEHFPVSIEHSTFQLEMGAHAGHELPAHD